MNIIARLLAKAIERLALAIEAALPDEDCGCDLTVEDDEREAYHAAWTEVVDNAVIARVSERDQHFEQWAKELTS
jgi:hypothetical protein